MDKAALESYYKANHDRFLEEWKTFLAFESISTDSAYNDKCTECAQWLVTHLEGMGLHAELLETSTKPVVHAYKKGKDGASTVVYYGHYDVQPVDPLDLWDTPPFEPTLRGSRLYARGAQDNKGQTFYFLKALETLLANDALDNTIKIFIEGEEETGSYGITESIPKWKDKLQGDVLMVCDTGAVAKGVPTVTMGLRGINHLEVYMGGIKHDLHSGSHGGMVKNPAMEMARLMATLHDESGRIAVEGYYDDVANVSEQDKELANAGPFTEEGYKEQIGVLPTGGEDGFTAVERKGFRPTIEINGIHSGYGGEGNKTIIPSEAIAKVSCRLVGNQDPQKSLEQLVAHLEKHAPKDLDFEIRHKTIGGPALLVSSTSPVIQKAAAVLDQLSDEKPVYSWEGGSIPVVAELAKVSGAEPLLIGFGLEEDRIHAPNESFDVDQFALGFLYASLMLQAL
ncbi:MAG TPA: dipeptidase [Myxococcales bacterium]|nr:hypothetical protein [Deltaproteobacteria bacterium]MBU51257.1 hypothetical protein [Deltaproteobacteria bacterium]HAA55114.1 dipeptidase [Myxococcales bacterium]|tara:strand:+ start:65 stop:1426 length:1362 start_codon:yes stop_codon:yes gene_type:complete